MNAVATQFEIIAGHNWCDLVGEEDTVGDAEGLVAATRLALADGQVTSTEALDQLARAERVLAQCRASHARTLYVQGEIEAFRRFLAGLPAEAIARLPKLPRLLEEHELFSAEAVFSADVRGRYPRLGAVTVGQVLRAQDDDLGEAA